MTDYNWSGQPTANSRGLSGRIREEFSKIQIAVNSKADKDSPALVGTPTAPTATLGTGTTQIATTEFVANTSLSASLPGQAGNAGKFLGTNGTVASWGDLPPPEFNLADLHAIAISF